MGDAPLLPEIGSVWKERDNRFERYIEVVGLEGFAGSLPAPIAHIRTIRHVWKGGYRPQTGRVTRAKISAFGKRYVLETPPQVPAPPVGVTKP